MKMARFGGAPIIKGIGILGTSKTKIKMIELLEKLQVPFPESVVKWKVQAEKGAWSTFVAYVDSRIVAQKLDDCAVGLWQDEYREVNGLLICRIGIYSIALKEWVWREDTGTESSMDKEKGHVSDAFKRAAVKWGIGRHLYEMPIIKIKNLKDGKAVYRGKLIYDATTVCRELIKANRGKSQIWHDDSKSVPQNNQDAPPTPPKDGNAGKGINKEIFSELQESVGSTEQRNLIANLLSSSQFDSIRNATISKLNKGASIASDVIEYLQTNIK